jgi:hypothetical protein
MVVGNERDVLGARILEMVGVEADGGGHLTGSTSEDGEEEDGYACRGQKKNIGKISSHQEDITTRKQSTNPPQFFLNEGA